jgi:endonuclease/exonuclease/phosphatase family metal-dependent hydrolase
MTTSNSRPSDLDHDLQVHFADLARFDSTLQCESSALYGSLKPEIDRVLGGVDQDDLRCADGAGDVESPIRAVAWNLERGIRLDGIIDALRTDLRLASGAVYLLTEIDYGMARAANRHVAREIAQALGLAYVFAPCYLALNKGAGVEAEAEGENTLALHGNALMARHPLLRAHTLMLPNGKDKMVGREKRLGSQRAIIADVDHPLGMFRAVVVHLDAHSTQRHRRLQMRLVLDHLDELLPRLPVLIGGDWNTTTHDASRALYSILGYCRRVLMGVRGVLANHYPYPDRWFERHLFREIESRGYRYRDLNVPGGCTLHYSVQDLAANRNMGEWIPQWCFWFISWALEKQGGRCSLKLDWFAGKGIRPDESDQGRGPAILGDLGTSGTPLSDHDPILLDFTPESHATG